jgi:hypothetical protein
MKETIKNTVQTIQNTVNTSTHITKILTQMSKHPHITKPTHTHTHVLLQYGLKIVCLCRLSL